MEIASEKIYSILQKLAEEFGVKDINFSVEAPKDRSHGDLATNLALVLFKKIKLAEGQPHVARDARKTQAQSSKAPRSLSESRQQASKDNKKGEKSSFNSLANGLSFGSPLELAQQIAQILNTKYKILNTYFEKIEAVSPGFINFYFSKKYLQSQVQNIIEKGSSYGSTDVEKGKKASVEFVSANPTGPLHIGNARGGPLGDTIANVLEKAGYKVTREYLHNDVGGQVQRLGEALYFELNPEARGENYVAQYQGSYVKELAEFVEEELYEDEDLSQSEFVEKGGKAAVRIMLEEILKDCEAMGIKYDVIRKESDLRHKVPQVLNKIKKSLVNKEGALWFAPYDEFLKDRQTVVRKSDGEYTYFASDIAYHDEKMSKNDLVIDILGANHSGHVPRLQAAVKALGFDTNNFKVILYQFVRLKRGREVIKMSKRAGNFVTAKEVLDEVGKDAFRFFMLSTSSNTHMDFDLSLAKKKAQENPVFYVQYAYTRIASIFAKIKNQKSKVKSETQNLKLLNEREEIELIRKLIEFPYLVEEVSNNLQVNLLANYALDLASLFHKFYEKHQVLSGDKDLSSARLKLLKATQITLKNTLDLLGVTAPEKM